jgi:exopolyphosphatase/guanosine-5'-triphosphate,3'-diphosphate pyrophosphatase
VDRAVAIGGSASSLKNLAGSELGERELAAALGVLRTESSWDIAARFELARERVRLLPAGLLVLEELSRRVQRPLRICKGGLREGVILEMIRKPD